MSDYKRGIRMNGTVVIALLVLAYQWFHAQRMYSIAQETLSAYSHRNELLASRRFDHVEDLRSGMRMLIFGMAIFLIGDVYLAFLWSVGVFTSLLVFGLSIIVGLCFIAKATRQINLAYRLYTRRWRSYKNEFARTHFAPSSSRF